MKTFYAILCLVIASLTQLQAQAPQGFNYQATVRNNAGDLIVNTSVYFKFNIQQGSQTAVPSYTEVHYVATDDLGQVNLVIGQGTPSTGTFSELDWSLGSYFLSIELDTGNGYVAMGTTQLLSVPYALYAENSGNSTPTTPNLEAILAENNSANNQQIKDLQDPTDAQDAVTKNYTYSKAEVDALIASTVENLQSQIDDDNDGYSENQGDCDDNDAQVNPGATEIEDGIDNDCDGDIDEGFDIDGDGYTVGQGDCDDNDAQVNPGATEIEDGIDNDCDGEIDEGFNEVTDIDGNTYDYLTYGDQVWTVENAEMVTYRDGTPIPEVTDPTQWSNLTTGAWCYYNNNPTKPRLYNWYAVMGIHDNDPNTPNKEFAPAGWHVPSDAEWTTLENYLIANGYNYDGTTTANKIAKAMASNTGWENSTFAGAPGNDPSLNNSSGFNAFPEGWRNLNGSSSFENTSAIFWSSTENSSDNAWNRDLGTFLSYLNRYHDDKRVGYSVRFVRDSDVDLNDVDNDGDGYTENEGDCDDNDAQVNPGATEIEDGIDNDCDGDIDEGFDIDGDGYTVGQGDCDDNNAQVNPGATEIEDGIDNDCDGDIDEGFNEVTDIDGNTYDYLTYYNQVWTVKNAEMVTYRDGTPIPQVTDETEWENLTTGAWSYYNNDPTKPRLYNWYAVAGIHDTDPNTPNKEFAPEGWHVPSDPEWTTLENYLIANGYNYDGTTTENKIAKAMASNTGWNSSTNTGSVGNDQSLNNSSGFNAFPEGFRIDNGSFSFEGSTAVFWSSTESNSNNASCRALDYNLSDLYGGNVLKRRGFSVRFVRVSDVDLNDVDNDGDGYTENQGDCDDSDANVNPGATEIEDGINNDCDGEIDEGFNESGSVTDQDGNTYDYLTYGTQQWTVENAEMVTYRDGTPIPQVTDNTEWESLTTGAWAYYDNDPTKPRLYNWYAVMGIHDNDPNTPNKEFAPEGWHVTSDAEWTTLENYLIANGYNYDGTTTGNKIAKAMASTTGWISSTGTGAVGNDQSLNNSSGFNAFPEGRRNDIGSFNFESSIAFFWSSTEDGSSRAWNRNLNLNSSGLSRNGINKHFGFSVRFVRD